MSGYADDENIPHGEYEGIYSPPLITWVEPVDLFQPLVLPKLKPEWLPQVIADFALDQAEIIGCDPSILAQSCLNVCATATHDYIKLQPNEYNHGWTESARIWSAIIGDPSSKKSPALARATSHLRKIDIQLFEAEAKAKANFELQKRIYDAAEKAYIADQAKHGQKAQPTPPEEPQIDRMIVEDTTIAALSEILKSTERGILVLADELAGWLGSMDQFAKGTGSTNADRAHWLSAYNGGPRRIDRIGRGSFLVRNWSACILGGIQPDVMRRIFKSMPEDGLLQRFIPIVAADGTPGSNRRPNGAAIGSYNTTIDRLYAYPASEQRIRLTAEAEEIHDQIIAYYYELKELDCLPKPLLGFMGKWEGLSPRLMLTFHLIECASADENPWRPISEATAERVMLYMKEFLFRHALIFYEETLSDSGITDAVRWIGGYILAHKKADLTNRDLLRSFSWWTKARDWEKQQVSTRLIDLGWLSSKDSRDRFKTVPSIWAVNPKVHTQFSDRASEESYNRQRAIDMIRKNTGACD